MRHWQRQREQQHAANLGFGRILAMGEDKHPIGDCSDWNPNNGSSVAPKPMNDPFPVPARMIAYEKAA